MTTLLSWISVDARGPSGIYIVGDSRITWGSASRRWDSGRKVFACRSADIFGYCGDVLYPTLVLGQLGDLVDRNLLWQGDANAEARHTKIVEYLKASFERRHNAPDHDFTILHCARDGDGQTGSFYIWKVSYRATLRDWLDERVVIGDPITSMVLLQLGSGNHALSREIAAWEASPQGGTARAIFSAFCDSLDKEGDALSGGAPQIVALHRSGSGKVIGFIAEGMRYLYGLPIQLIPELDNVMWVDSLFQRVSPETGTLLPNAQRHTRVGKGKGFVAFVTEAAAAEEFE